MKENGKMIFGMERENIFWLEEKLISSGIGSMVYYKETYK